MPAQPLQIKNLCGAELSDAQLQAMSQLRSRIMQLKPGLNRVRDFEKFCAYCRSCHTVSLFYAPDGELVGMTNFRLLVVHDEAGRRHWFINPDYAFMRADYRGHPALPRNLLQVFFTFFLAWRGEPIWFGGTGYPTSLMFVDDICGSIELNSDPPQPGMGRQLIVQLIHDWGSNWDTQRGCANMPTIPPAMGPRWQAMAESNPMYQRYLAACPDWQAGYGLAGIARLRPLSTALRLLGKGLRRLLTPRHP